MTADEIEINQIVERAFDANRKRRGEICEIPIVGGDYIPGLDRTKRLKERRAVRLLPASGSSLMGQQMRLLFPFHIMSVRP